MRSLIRLIRPDLRQLALGGLLGGFSLSAAVGLLAASAWLISMASTRPPILVLQVSIVFVRFFGLSRGTLKYAARIVEHDAALKIQTSLRIRIYEQISKLLPFKFSKLTSGNLLSQIINDVELVQDLWLRVLMPWFNALIAGVSGLGIILYLYPPAATALSLIFLSAMFFVPLLAALISVPQNEREQEARLFSQVMQVSESANESLVFNFKNDLLLDLEIAQDAIAVSQSRSARRSGYASGLHVILVGTATVTALYFAARGFLAGDISGISVAVISLLPLVIFEAIGALPAAFSQLSRIIEATRNLAPFISSEIEEFDLQVSKSLAQSVNFDFMGVNPIIEDASCSPLTAQVSPGETLIIMGKSGSGNREIEQMLEIVELADLVHKLPEGLDTHVGPLGYNFSGGEKQRMKLARLLLRNTPVFILDEPYEFLDANQVARIASKVARILATKTVIIVSHQELNIPAKVMTLSK